MLLFLPGMQREVRVPSSHLPRVEGADSDPSQDEAKAGGEESPVDGTISKELHNRFEGIMKRIQDRQDRLEAVLAKLDPALAAEVLRDDVQSTAQDLSAVGNRVNQPLANDNSYQESSRETGGRFPELPEDREKRAAVKAAMEHAWSNYRKYAWGLDELQPKSKTGNNWLGLGATIVDSLDTLWIMGMFEEFREAVDWTKDNLNFHNVGSVSFFETTIRALGGLLAAHGLSKEPALLEKAEDLGKRLIKAFETPHGIPHASVNLKTGQSNNPGWIRGRSVLSEMGTVQLEFLYLARLTGKPEYAAPAMDVFKHLDKIEKRPEFKGLHSLFVSVQSGEYSGSRWSLGALGDSFYEYLLKVYLWSGSQFEGLRRMYDESSEAMHESVVLKSDPSKLTYIAELDGGRLVHKMDHLVCFAGGMFALGADGPTRDRDFSTGEEITRTCHEMYARMKTGIAPEIVEFSGGNDFRPGNRATHYLLRPETVESFFVLWRLTGDQQYRDWGWEVFQAIERYCRLPDGYSGIRDVTNANVVYDNQQQSFFLAETLKYLYLLFTSSEVIPLDHYVFNTEAHPFPIMKEGWNADYLTHFPPATK
eukprot:CAMPEP_0119118784 /NCGR_PEP_ID=MMETSP1310-20130426/545_1 /TAXON_ID=464262 /ORGANISM="Genus nov. species nov., Strain RCC2339" /LENGTH=591 /DNA_ID=CAMNT_0007108175 /DNA_START=149 /DNA_END=1924 /DNA_ORIENTATION=+